MSPHCGNRYGDTQRWALADMGTWQTLVPCWWRGQAHPGTAGACAEKAKWPFLKPCLHAAALHSFTDPSRDPRWIPGQGK